MLVLYHRKLSGFIPAEVIVHSSDSQLLKSVRLVLNSVPHKWCHYINTKAGADSRSAVSIHIQGQDSDCPIDIVDTTTHSLNVMMRKMIHVQYYRRNWITGVG